MTNHVLLVATITVSAPVAGAGFVLDTRLFSLLHLFPLMAVHRRRRSLTTSHLVKH